MSRASKAEDRLTNNQTERPLICKIETMLDDGRPKDALSELLKNRNSLTACNDNAYISTMYYLHAKA